LDYKHIDYFQIYNEHLLLERAPIDINSEANGLIASTTCVLATKTRERTSPIFNQGIRHDSGKGQATSDSKKAHRRNLKTT
jgi:hypothetical protein